MLIPTTIPHRPLSFASPAPTDPTAYPATTAADFSAPSNGSLLRLRF